MVAKNLSHLCPRQENYRGSRTQSKFDIWNDLPIAYLPQIEYFLFVNVCKHIHMLDVLMFESMHIHI